MTLQELQTLKSLVACLAPAHDWPAAGPAAALLTREIERQLALENLVHTLPGYAEHMANVQAGIGIGWTPTLLELAKAAPRSEPPVIPHLFPGGRDGLERHWLATRIGMMLGLCSQRGTVEILRCIEWVIGILDPRLPAVLAEEDLGLRRQFVAMTEQVLKMAQARHPPN